MGDRRINRNFADMGFSFTKQNERANQADIYRVRNRVAYSAGSMR